MCHYSYHAHFILSYKSERRVTKRNKRLVLWSLFINWGTQCLITADWIAENDLSQMLCICLNYLSQCSLQPNILPKVIKTINLPKDSKNEQVGQFWLAYQTWLVGEMTITFELLKVSKMISLKIYISPVKEKLETPNLNSR